MRMKSHRLRVSSRNVRTPHDANLKPREQCMQSRRVPFSGTHGHRRNPAVVRRPSETGIERHPTKALLRHTTLPDRGPPRGRAVTASSPRAHLRSGRRAPPRATQRTVARIDEPAERGRPSNSRRFEIHGHAAQTSVKPPRTELIASKQRVRRSSPERAPGVRPRALLFR